MGGREWIGFKDGEMLKLLKKQENTPHCSHADWFFLFILQVWRVSASFFHGRFLFLVCRAPNGIHHKNLHFPTILYHLSRGRSA